MSKQEESPNSEVRYKFSQPVEIKPYNNALIIDGEFVLSTRSRSGSRNVALDILCETEVEVFRNGPDTVRRMVIPRDLKDRDYGEFNTRYVILTPGESAELDYRLSALYLGEINSVRRFQLKSIEQAQVSEVAWLQDPQLYLHYINPNII